MKQRTMGHRDTTKIRCTEAPVRPNSDLLRFSSVRPKRWNSRITEVLERRQKSVYHQKNTISFCLRIKFSSSTRHCKFRTGLLSGVANAHRRPTVEWVDCTVLHWSRSTFIAYVWKYDWQFWSAETQTLFWKIQQAPRDFYCMRLRVSTCTSDSDKTNQVPLFRLTA